jgi:4-amino-4-deoxy-L-arabinose transferase-like glycosyltransferase
MAVPELAEVRASAPVGAAKRATRSLSDAEVGPALLVGAMTMVGIVIRVLVARQSLFGDELSTYWISATHGLRSVISLLYGSNPIHHAEITPPLYFVAAWVTTQFGHSALLLRLPSLVAGGLIIPLVYLLGDRTIGRKPALVATALTTLAPFMIYYSTEARAYSLMVLLVTLSTLTMLLAIDTRRAGWWAVYAISSCAAVYTHLTCVFVLGAQLLWLLWADPQRRRPAVIANLAVLAGLLPWTVGFVTDLTSPTVKILSALSPFNAREIPIILGHWALGYPYANSARLSQLPGTVALVLLVLVTVVSLAGIATQAGRDQTRWSLARLDRRVVLVLVLALATPIGEAIVSTFSTHIFGVRNLAASWPALAMSFALLTVAAGRRLRIAAVGLAIVSFAIGAQRMLVEPYERPDYQAAADFITRQAGPSDVVIDETGDISPGPLTPLDVTLGKPLRVFRAGSPVERDHPFGFTDPIASLRSAVSEAEAAARGGRIFVVSTVTVASDIPLLQQRTQSQTPRLRASYRLVRQRIYPGIARVKVQVYAVGARPGR